MFDDPEVVLSICNRLFDGTSEPGEALDQRRNAPNRPAAVTKVSSDSAPAVRWQRNRMLRLHQARRKIGRQSAVGELDQIDVGEAVKIVKQRGDTKGAATLQRVGRLGRKNQRFRVSGYRRGTCNSSMLSLSMRWKSASPMRRRYPIPTMAAGRLTFVKS